MAAYLRPRETGEIKTTIADEIGEMVRSIGHVAEYYMADPARAIEAQTALTTQFIDLWAATLQRFQGMPAKPVAEPDRVGQALLGRGVARQSVLRLSQAGLCADDALGGRSGPTRRRTRAAHARQGAVLSAPGLGGARAVELHRHQSRTHPRDPRGERREPRARPEDAGRGHRGRKGEPAHPPVGRAARSSSASISPSRPGRSSSATS